MAIETSTNRKIRKQFCARLCLTFARFSTLNTFLYLISLKFVQDFLNKTFFYIIFLLLIIIKLSIKEFLIPQISYFFRNTQVQTQDLAPPNNINYILCEKFFLQFHPQRCKLFGRKGPPKTKKSIYYSFKHTSPPIRQF